MPTTCGDIRSDLAELPNHILTGESIDGINKIVVTPPVPDPPLRSIMICPRVRQAREPVELHDHPDPCNEEPNSLHPVAAAAQVLLARTDGRLHGLDTDAADGAQ